ncbi:MAG: DUF4355 domain-containing protein [Clostridia bacterium]|nr:DUF4355 domain-containing protein [Clostridia bacterium]
MTLEDLRAMIASEIDARLTPETQMDERENALLTRELRLKAIDLLKAKELPETLLPVLPLTDEETLTAAVDALDAAFREALRAAVDERLKGATPTAPDNTPDPDTMTDEEYYRTLAR